jgi:hypothetical protein
MKRSIILALAAVLALAIPASADNVTEGFTVGPYLTVSGIPASITYTLGGNDLLPGQTSDAKDIVVAVLTNADLTVNFSGTAFGALSQDIREVKFTDGPQYTIDPAVADWATTSDAEAVHPVVSSMGGTDADFGVHLRVTVPADTLRGGYSGSITLSFTAA